MLMTKLSKIALLGAVALMAAVGCQREVVEEVNPNYNALTGEVTTDFVINVSSGNTPTTKMTAANTQATISEAFRGINNAKILTFKLKSGETLTDGKHVSGATTAERIYDMGTVLDAGALDPDGDGTIPKSRRVLEIALPTETNTIMFWGKAVKDGTSAAQGSITYTVDKNLSATRFTLNKRIPVSNDDPLGSKAFDQYLNLMAACLTKIINTSITYSDVDYEGTKYSGSLAWKDHVEITSSGTPAIWKMTKKTVSPVVLGSADDGTRGMSALGQILCDAFYTLNTIYPNEVRAGSGPALATTLSDLRDVINSVADATPTSAEETITKILGQQIRANINSVLEGAVWKDVNSLNAIKTFSGLNANDCNLVTKSPNDFPAAFSVPAGACVLNIDLSTLTYSYSHAIPTYAMDGGAGASFDPLNYVYPAELCYFGNSPIRVTSDPHTTAQYPDGVANWIDDASWAAGKTFDGAKAWTKNGHVLSTTRAVAMQETINYGTALLKSTVRFGAATLQDNNHNIQAARSGANEENNTFDATQAGLFTLKGILIGGVEPTVGWNYLPLEGATWNTFLYDNSLPSAAIPAYDSSKPVDQIKSAANYTLLWDNWNSANKGNKQNVVYVALEFVNNSGKNFWGMNNLIRNGATFYITGKMDPDAGLSTDDRSLGITWPTNYALPPYDESGNTIKERRIFIQDYMTEANFVIGATSLQKAIISVPDLRSTQISLGLSVDLTWSSGLSFPSIELGAE